MNNRIAYFASDRKRCYSLFCVEDTKEGTKEVSAIFPESDFHLSSWMRHRGLFEKLGLGMPELISQTERKLTFELVEGRSLLDDYKEVVKNADKTAAVALLEKHKALALGSDSCRCEFSENGDFSKFFNGAPDWSGRPARNPANFSAYAGAIIYKNDAPVFTDCEWAFNFPVPEDVITLQWLEKLYIELPELDKLVSRSDAEARLISDIENAEKTLALFYEEINDNDEKELNDLCLYLKYKDSKGIDRLAKETIEKDKTINELRRQLAQLQAEKDQLEQFKEQVLNSTTWKTASKFKKVLGRD